MARKYKIRNKLENLPFYNAEIKNVNNKKKEKKKKISNISNISNYHSFLKNLKI